MTTRSDKAALALFEQAKAQRDAGTLDAAEFALGVPGTLPRVRLAQQVNLEAHDPDCERCSGGIRGYEQVGDERVPIVCVCVSRGGGVEPDKFDKLHAGPEQQQGNRAARRAARARARRAN